MLKKSLLVGCALLGLALPAISHAAPHGGGGHTGGSGHGPTPPAPQPPHNPTPAPQPPHNPWPTPQPNNNPPRSVYCMSQNENGTQFVATAYGQVPGAFQVACNSAMEMCYRSGFPNQCRVVSQW